MNKFVIDISCVFRIHLARLRAEWGPFLMAALVFPTGMYLFANGIVVENTGGGSLSNESRLRFLAASLVFSLSLTAISWFGYLLLEDRFTGRLKLFASLPVRVSAYVFGVLIFALAQGAVGTVSMLIGAWLLGVRTEIAGGIGVLQLSLIVFLALLSLAGLSLVVASRARSFSEGSLMTDALGAGMVLLAPVYYPAQALPSVLQWVDTICPTTYIFRATNKVLSGNTAIGAELIVLGVMAAIILTIGCSQMTWKES